MKKLSIINKLIYFINYIFAILLLLGFVLPLISPSLSPRLSVLSLTIPLLFIVNLLFLAYWLLGFKRQFILSLVCLILGFFLSSPLYKIGKSSVKTNNEIRIMNYNVRLFNNYKWIKDNEIPQKITNFIEAEKPDIVCFQEFHPLGEKYLDKIFKYKFIKLTSKKSKIGQAIYSNFKIVNEGSLDFKGSVNNAIFIDIIKGLDTLRIYNLHLESLGLNVDKENFGQKDSERLWMRLSNEFKKQQVQVEQVVAHKNSTKLPVIISGDFNNTAYSWTYNKLSSGMNDSYIEAGKGFGKTFDIKNFPMRIDFLLSDKVLSINKHKNYNIKYSDHTPIMVNIGL